MFKKISTLLLSVLVIVSVTLYFSTLALAEKKQEGEQFGQTKGEATPQKGEAGPLKENICKNPKLCDSIEIDLLNSLSQAKVPVLLPETQAAKTDKDYQAAINMGAAVADALASIAKKDKDTFLKNVSQAQEFGKQLGVSEKVMGKFKDITAAAEKKQWDKLGMLLYEFKDGMINELNESNKKPLASLAMLSGGVEGFYITAKSVNGKYTPKCAELLKSPDLVTYIKTYMEDLTPELKDQSGIKAFSGSVPELEKTLSELQAKKCGQAEVKNILDLATSMRQDLLGS
jgi:hypothetical protein